MAARALLSLIYFFASFISMLGAELEWAGNRELLNHVNARDHFRFVTLLG